MLSSTAILANGVEAELTTRPNTTILFDAAIVPPHGQAVTEEAIRHRAYLKWVARGKPSGNGENFWREAESELLLGN